MARPMPLKQLTQRRLLNHDRKAILRALERLDARATGEGILPELVEAFSATRRSGTARRWGDPIAAARFIELTSALRASRRISRQEYLFFTSSAVSGVHEGRWMERLYDDDLGGIHEAMDALRKEYHLAADEYWPKSQAPAAYRLLDRKYGSVLDDHFVKTLREFGLNDVADLKQNNPDEFERLSERGRRAIHHKSDIVPALRDIVVQYEAEAARAASAKACSAAITSLGAGLEGVLLLRCLRSRRKAQATAASLPKRSRPRSPDDPTTWTFGALIEVCQKAGWFPPLSTSAAEYSGAGLAEALRGMRNFIHPARHARERPWSEADEEDYRDAEDIYTILRSKMAGGSERVKAGT
jgi:hypothetical protein